MTVPIKPFGGAVRRNYAKRRLREFFRREKYLFPEKTDILIRLDQPPEDWDQLLDTLRSLLRQITTMRIRLPKENKPRPQ